MTSTKIPFLYPLCGAVPGKDGGAAGLGLLCMGGKGEQ